jgi:CRISPR-associated protein Cmr2
MKLLGDGTLPITKLHQLAAMLRKMPEPESAPEAGWAALLRSEARRILARAEAGGEGKGVSPADVGLDLDGEDYALLVKGVERWIERMQIARFLASAKPQARRAARASQEKAR